MVRVRSYITPSHGVDVEWPAKSWSNGRRMAWFWWRWCQQYPEDVEFRDAEERRWKEAA